MSQRPVQDAPNHEPVYPVVLLPEVRERIEQYAREQKIPVPVALAEAARAFVGLSE